MPEKPPGPSEPAEVRTIRHLVRLMHKYDVTAIDLTDGSSRIRLRRRGAETPPLAANPSPTAATMGATPATMGPTPPATAIPPPAAAGIVIGSPMIGTFYASSAPDAAPYVTVGTVVRPETTVGIIEAMKVFTDIPAAVSGTITEVLVKNGQAVEFDTPLFRVNPA